jgi:hypothetical protein
MLKIGLVADKHDNNVFVGVLASILQPVLQVVESITSAPLINLHVRTLLLGQVTSSIKEKEIE